MNVQEISSNTLALKLLSLAAAVLLWLFVTYGLEATLVVQIPLEIRHLAPDLVVAGEVPSSVALTVSGPKIQVQRLAGQNLRLPLDLEGVGAGSVAFPDMQRLVPLPAGVRVTRVYPAALELRLEKSVR